MPTAASTEAAFESSTWLVRFIGSIPSKILSSRDILALSILGIVEIVLLVQRVFTSDQRNIPETARWMGSERITRAAGQDSV
jgi:hypothetical protein